MNLNTWIRCPDRKWAANAGVVPHKSESLGFSLIELMIVVAIVAILAAIALPSYQSSIRKSRRTLAKTALLDLASREEKLFSMKNAYSGTYTDLGYPSALPLSLTDGGVTPYTLSVVFDNTTNPPTFTGTATPSSDQSIDTCGTYTINSFGQQTPTSAGCW